MADSKSIRETWAGARTGRNLLRGGVGMWLVVALAICAGGGAEAFARAATDIDVASGNEHLPLRFRWSRESVIVERGEGGVLALAHDGSRLAVATRDRVAVVLGDAFATTPLEDIRDLAFDRKGGVLYVATGAGLWRLDDGQSTTAHDVSPAPGEAARAVRRIEVAERWIAIATDAGVYVALRDEVSRDAGAPRFVPVNQAFPTRGVRDIAIAGDGLFALVDQVLWRAELARGGMPFAAREIRLPARIDEEAEVSLVDFPGDDRIAIVGGDEIFLAATSDLQRIRTGTDVSASWKVLRPVLPPGARINRLGAFARGYWMATDRGLLLAPRLTGPWQRADAPAGRAIARELVEVGGDLLVASSIGVLRGRPVRSVEASAPSDEWDTNARAPAPSIQAVQRMALREQGLEAQAIHQARRGVRRRAWFPVVGLSFDVDRGRSRGRDRDESFVSGAYHTLHDRDRDKNLDLAGGVSFTWDFRDAAFDPESIDVSREARLVIGLRDDVIDEVNQLYFDRLAVVSQLSVPAAADAETAIDRGALALRLLQLTAGLDAWTGGWFSEQLDREIPALE